MFHLSEGNHCSAVIGIIFLSVREWKSIPRGLPLPLPCIPASCQLSVLCPGTWSSEALSLSSVSPMLFSPLCPALTLSMSSCLSIPETLSFLSSSSYCALSLVLFPLPSTLLLNGRPVLVTTTEPSLGFSFHLVVKVTCLLGLLICHVPFSLCHLYSQASILPAHL